MRQVPGDICTGLAAIPLSYGYDKNRLQGCQPSVGAELIKLNGILRIHLRSQRCAEGRRAEGAEIVVEVAAPRQ